MNIDFSLRTTFWDRRRLPIILQSEVAECGLACVAMIASYWGYQARMTSFREHFAISLKGATLKSLIETAQALSLRARPLKLGLKNLKELKCPCILHWDMSHFVVLHKVHGSHLVIHDPAVGIRKLSVAEASKHFTGVALELTPSQNFRQADQSPKISLSSLTGRIAGLGRGIIQLLLIGGLVQAATLMVPFYLQWIVDEALVAADRNLVIVLGIGFALLSIAQTALSAIRSWATTAISAHLNFQWFDHVFEHLFKLPLPFFEKRSLGEIISRFNSIQTIQRSLTTQFVDGILDGLLSIGTLVMLVIYSPTMSLIAICALALYVAARAATFRILNRATGEQIAHAAKQQTLFIESARGAQSIRLFGRENERRTTWLRALAEQFNADIRISKLSIANQLGNSVIFGVERVLVISIGALTVLNGQLTVGMLLAFLSYKDQFTLRTSSFIDKVFDLKMLSIHAERVAEIAQTKPEEDQPPFGVDLAGISPTIELRNVSFRYSASEEYVIRNFSIQIPAGQSIAITGASGCGKTTLLKLMLGILNPTEGEIYIGGHLLSTLGLSNYRQLTAAVMQEDQLFVGSILDNVSFFDSTPCRESIEACCKQAALHNDIVSMPMGYHTLVGDIGVGLSGGQKQRLLLARALYKRPRIVFLDEATSHLDIESERQVNSAIGDAKMTRILVAHRQETINSARRIITLSRGELASEHLCVNGERSPVGRAPSTSEV